MQDSPGPKRFEFISLSTGDRKKTVDVESLM